MDYQEILSKISSDTSTPKPKARQVIRAFLACTEEAAHLNESFTAAGYRIRHETLASGAKRSIIRKVSR